MIEKASGDKIKALTTIETTGNSSIITIESPVETEGKVMENKIIKGQLEEQNTPFSISQLY